MGFKTKVSHVKVKNVPLKDTNGKGELKRMFSQFFFSADKGRLLVTKLSLEEFEVFLHGGAFCLF